MPRFFSIFVALLVVTLGAIGLSRLSFNVSLIKLLPQDLPGVKGTIAIQDLQDEDDLLLLTIESLDGTDVGDVAADLAERLAAEPGLVGSVQHEPAWHASVEGLSDLTAHAWLNAPPERLLELKEALAPERIDAMLKTRLDTIAETFNPLTATMVSRDPLGLGAILSGLADSDVQTHGGDEFSTGDGTYRVVKVSPPHQLAGYRDISRWLETLRGVVSEWQRTQSEAAAVRIAYTGSPAFEAEIGTGMEKDLSQSVSGITLIVGLLFWLLHRRIRPLFYLMLAMLVTGLLTLGVAGLAFGTLDVMSMGFAAILMGMIEDFGVMGLNESMRRPDADFRSVHAAVFPSIAWSAVTSAAVFGVLGLSTLPGIAQMGVLTALGILIGAAVMLYGFLPLAMRGRGSFKTHVSHSNIPVFANWQGWCALALILLCVGALATQGLPAIDNSTGVLRPRQSEAFVALTNMQERLQPSKDDSLWLPVVVRGNSAEQLSASMRGLETRLESATKNGQIAGRFLPSLMVPDPARQATNLPVLAGLAGKRDDLASALDTAGFTSEGMAFSLSVLDIWKQWDGEQMQKIRWPDAGLLRKFIGPVLQQDGTGFSACGFVLLPKSVSPGDARVLMEIQQDPAVQVGGLEYLSGQLKKLLGGEIKRLLLPAAAALGILLFLVFRNTRERMMAVGSLAFSGLLLFGLMSMSGMTWNFVNIGAVPIALGLGLDFNIHMIHALRKRGADGHGIGRALAYCGMSTGLGFGALALSDNVGMASFGMTSMIGVLATLITAAVFLPWVWRRLAA